MIEKDRQDSEPGMKKKLILPPSVEARLNKDKRNANFEKEMDSEGNNSEKDNNEVKKEIENFEDALNEIENLLSVIEQKENEFMLLQADYANFQKRSRKNEEERLKYAIQDLTLSIIKQLDVFEQALSIDINADVSKMLEGFSMIYNGILKILSDYNVSEIAVEPGDFVNPEIHEVMITEQDPDKPNNTVSRIMLKGYKLSERVIRATKIISIQNPGKKEEPSTDVNSKPEKTEDIMNDSEPTKE